MRGPELPDRAAEETADFFPAVPERPPREGKASSDVELPERARDRPRHAELERRDQSSWAHRPRELRERRARIVDVAKEVREREVVEGAVGERERLGRGLDELDAIPQPSSRDGEHPWALVEPGDVESTTHELGGDEPRARCDVEDVPAVPRQAGDEEAAPERVLAEREHGADAVVRRSERGEQRTGVHGGHEPYSGAVDVADELKRIAGLAAAHAAPGDAVSGIIPTEPEAGARVYLCAFDDADGLRSWLAVREDGSPVESRVDLREAVSIAALCEVATDAAGGGDLDALIARLVELRDTEGPPGIEAAEDAARALQGVLAEPPQLATPARLDEIGAATRRLEHELDPTASSPFSAAMQSSQEAVSELQREIEAGYRLPLS